MRIPFILFLTLWSTFAFAQEHFFLKSDTRLYSSPSTSSSFLGYFRYGARIELLSENQNGWSKVKADNLSEGFVPSQFVSTTLNARDSYIIDAENPIIETGDGHYGNSHMFVLAAGLKARALPDKTSKSKQILTCGEVVGVKYLPINPEDWVNISGSLDAEYSSFVQRKYLGTLPDYDQLLKQFDQIDVNNLAERKTIAERIVELAWNSSYDKLTSAYERYYQVAKQLNNDKIIAETEFNIVLAKKLNNQKSEEQQIAFTSNAEFIIKGIKSKGFLISYKELIAKNGKPSKTEEISDECGVFLSPLFYHYSDLEVSVDVKQNKVELVSVTMNSTNKFMLNQSTLLDNTTTEKEFISRFGDYITTTIQNPHNYYLQLDGGTILLEFKDGKLLTVTVNYMC